MQSNVTSVYVKLLSCVTTYILRLAAQFVIGIAFNIAEI